MSIEEQAKLAVEKHRRLLCHKCIELSLGELVALDGIREVRKILLRYLVHLRDY